MINIQFNTFKKCYGQNQQTTNWYFSYFSQKIRFDISCKLSPKETICMKCQFLFSQKIRIIFQNAICWKSFSACLAFNIVFTKIMFRVLYLPKPLKCQENLHLKMSSVYVVYWIFLQSFQIYFCIQANSVHPDQTAPRGAVRSWSTQFAKLTFKITNRWQSRWQLLWFAV